MTEIEFALKKIIGCSNSPSVQYFLFDENHIIQEYAFGLADIFSKSKS